MIREPKIFISFLCIALASSACLSSPADQAPAPSTRLADQASVPLIVAGLEKGTITSAGLTRTYINRIAQLDQAGPSLRSVIAVNPQAIAAATLLDQERQAGRTRSPIHGLPLLLKDNIETADPVPTTAGSLALKTNYAVRDAAVAATLRSAGAVILGKTNLSEWSNIRSPDAVAGWSAVGGQTLNPHALDRSPSGSSSGSAVAVAAGFAPAAVGTDTGGSLTSPAATNGIVALRPTLGLVSRSGIVPIATSQDTAGPMARSVSGVAALLTMMAGTDPADPATVEADQRKINYSDILSSSALAGKRLGVMRFALSPYAPEVLRAFEAALDDLRAAGAEIIEVADYSVPSELGSAAGLMAITEFKEQLDAYLQTTPSGVRTRSLADLIAFNEANRSEEMALFGHEYWTIAQSTRGTKDSAYVAARRQAKRLAGTDGIDAMLRRHRLHALIAPTTNPARPLTRSNQDAGREASVAQLPAVAGYPHLTVPMGFVGALPVGLSFIGTAWADADLLAMGFAYEQRTRAIRPPRFLPTAE